MRDTGNFTRVVILTRMQCRKFATKWLPSRMSKASKLTWGKEKYTFHIIIQNGTRYLREKCKVQLLFTAKFSILIPFY